jgi:hypothetical protein
MRAKDRILEFLESCGDCPGKEPTEPTQSATIENELEILERAIESTKNRIFHIMKNNVDGESVKKNRQGDVQEYILSLLESRRNELKG